MGWNISHGGTPGTTYSYTTMEELFDRLEKAASWRQRRTLKPLLSRRKGEAFFSIEPRTAADIGATLIDLAPLLPRDDDWKGLATQFGQSALRAASANQPWVWR
ncbi:hypothetical protein ACFVZH_20820 [Streptomyces sp. NPDC059534]|uniref:DUF7739 domain-containing protein n=1 Tax=Streptomyces sp. NPDC059534 TaxID=3346859 RepID=UPI00369D9E3B